MGKSERRLVDLLRPWPHVEYTPWLGHRWEPFAWAWLFVSPDCILVCQPHRPTRAALFISFYIFLIMAGCLSPPLGRNKSKLARRIEPPVVRPTHYHRWAERTLNQSLVATTCESWNEQSSLVSKVYTVHGINFEVA